MAINESWVVSGVVSSSELEQAKALHGRIVARESRGFGDTDNAMRRLAGQLGLPYWTQWSLRQGRLKRGGQLLARLRAGWLKHLAASVREDLAALNDELEEAHEHHHADVADLAVEVAAAQALLADIAAALGAAGQARARVAPASHPQPPDPVRGRLLPARGRRARRARR